MLYSPTGGHRVAVGKVFVPAERIKEQCAEDEDWPAGLIELVRSSSVNRAYNHRAVEAWYSVSRQSGGLESRMMDKSPKYDGQQDDCRRRTRANGRADRQGADLADSRLAGRLSRLKVDP